MKSIPKKKYVLKKERHIRWNWEQSPEPGGLVRYHFVVVDDKNRKGIMNGILEQIQKVSSGIEIVREVEGKVEGSRLRYLLLTFDTVLSPSVIDFTKINKSIKQNQDLRERQKGSIENYVADFYSD